MKILFAEKVEEFERKHSDAKEAMTIKNEKEYNGCGARVEEDIV